MTNAALNRGFLRLFKTADAIDGLRPLEESRLFWANSKDGNDDQNNALIPIIIDILIN